MEWCTGSLCRKVWKSQGGESNSNMVSIVFLPGWDKVNWSLKILEITDPCPSGYVLNPGTISETGQLGYHKNMGSIDDCLQLCEAEKYCCAFEYSDSKKRCYLNVDCNPTKSVHKDYQYCMKEAGKLMFCIQKVSKC